MTAPCPNGHHSATTDYCDQCGAKLGGSAVQAPPGPAQATELLQARPLVTVAAEPCPRCGAARVAEDRFCEGCGDNFAADASGSPPTPPADPTPGDWEALVTVDRQYFERVSPAGIDFPDDARERRFALDKHELRIGRGPSPDAQPEIDLAAAGGDPAVSRLHAVLVRQDDGSYALVDRGSTNGTSINEEPTSIAADVAVPLADGDRVHIGAWTTITVQRTGARP
jgi:hypothetical protein